MSGLTGSGLVLKTNAGDELAVSSNGTVAFGQRLPTGTAYAVSVKAQPTAPNQVCTIGNASGVVGTGNVNDVNVACSTQGFVLGGTVSGLDAETSVVLRNNGGGDLTVSANGTFSFASPVEGASSYAITVGRQPLWQSCTVSQGSGTLNGAAIDNVAVNCTRQVHTSTVITGLQYIQQLAADADGNVYAIGNNRVLKIKRDGTSAVFAGSGQSGSADGNGTSASFSFLRGIAIANGNVYVVDASGIRKITPSGDVTKFVTTPSLTNPSFLTSDPAGNLYAIQDTHSVVKVTPAGVLLPLAGSATPGSANGNGAAAAFSYPQGLAADGNGNVYVADLFNYMVRKITPTGDVSTLMSNSMNGFFTSPTAVGADVAGNVYVADMNNSVIRRISPSGQLSTLAGRWGVPGLTDGDDSTALFDTPDAVVQGAYNELFVLENFRSTIRRISTTP